MNVGIVGGGGVGGGGSCTTVFASATGADDWEQVGASSTYVYAGQNGFTGYTKNICKAEVLIETKHGNIEALGWVAELRTLTDTTLDTVPVCTSASVLGSAMTNGEWATFTFTPACAISSGTTYAIVVVRDDYGSDGTNFLGIRLTTAEALTGQYAYWKYDYTIGDTSASLEMSVKLYE